MMTDKLKHAGLVAIAFWLLAIPAAAQTGADSTEVLSLSVNEALKQASESGYELLIAEQQKEAAKAGLNQANMVFLPQLSIEESAVKTNDPIGVFGIKLRQGVITAADFNPAMLNNPDAEHNFTTKFEIRQPILNPEGIFQRSAAKFQAKSAQDQLKAAKGQTKLAVKETYYQLVILDEQVEVIKKHVETSKKFEEQAADYFEQGLITKSDYLNAKVQSLDAEKQILNAENRRKTVNDQLLMLLGIEEEYLVKPTERPEADGIKKVPQISEFGMNAELMAIRNQVEASGAMLKSARSGFLPNLNVFGAYELHDTQIFGNQSNNYMIGASLKWDLFKGMKQIGLVGQRKAELKTAELQLEQSRLQNRMRIKSAERAISEAIKNIELSELAAEQSEENVRFRSDRYEQGMEKTTDLLMAETKHVQNRLSKLQALYQYHISVANLEYLLETEL